MQLKHAPSETIRHSASTQAAMSPKDTGPNLLFLGCTFPLG